MWTDAYLADCGHLSDEEHGRYMLLLMAMWRSPECRIPNDDEWMARRFKRTVAEVRSQFRPLIIEFCRSTGNWITQKRLSREHAYVRARSKKRSDAAKTRWEKENSECNSNAPTPSPTPTPSREYPPMEGAEAPPVALKTELYRLGKSVLGKSAGGQVTRLIQYHGSDVGAAMATLQLAAKKADPAEYVGAILKGDRQPETDWENHPLYRGLL